MQPLPIDSSMASILEKLMEPRASGSLVLEAPPGAGKTTRVPFAIAQQRWCKGQVLLTEPRRIAARLSASRVADERGLTLGREVGYRVRFDDRSSAETRVVYMTEGLLLRRLLSDPGLAGVDAVVFDEVHEQSADLEVVLAMVTRLQRQRPALRLVAMSATLDADAITRFWDDAPRVVSSGRSFDVSVEHDPVLDDRPLPIRVRSAVKEALQRPGDVLVFLPGAREIRECEEALRRQVDVELVPLHGDLPIEQQARAVRPADGARRVILSTNVAESSLTIDGVTTVIDSGLARIARHDPWSGVQRLELEEISQARCVQRAGRAGRTRPGVARRLYTSGNFSSRPRQETPELARASLSDTLLILRAANIDESQLDFLTTLGPQAWHRAEEQLRALGALDEHGVTQVGRRMLCFSLPSRLARVLVEAERLGIEDDGALAVAILAERDILRSAPSGGTATRGHLEAGDSDIEDRMFKFREAALGDFSASTLRALELDGASVRSVQQTLRQLRRLTRNAGTTRHELASPLTRALLSGFADRVAERKGKGQEVLLMNGSTARLSDSTVVMHPRLVLCLAADAPRGRQAGVVVRIAHRVDVDLLMDAAGEHIEACEELVWSNEKERVEETSSFTYGKITLDATISNARPSPRAGAVLFRVAKTKGVASFDPEASLERLAVRLGLINQHFPQALVDEGSDSSSLQWLRDPSLLTEVALSRACQTATRWEELTKLEWTDFTTAVIPHSLQSALAKWVPTHVSLSGGLRVQVHYQQGRVPWIEARLQNFFGMATAPTLCQGRTPLQLHLLAPNKRAVQVTTDLQSFWDRHYPTLRKELMRRYPKHLWPEDGRHAAPPVPGKIR